MKGSPTILWAARAAKARFPIAILGGPIPIVTHCRVGFMPMHNMNYDGALLPVPLQFYG